VHAAPANFANSYFKRCEGATPSNQR